MKIPVPGLPDLFCANHDGVMAIGLCEVCGKPICTKCVVQIGVHVLCNNPDHPEIVKGWSLVSRFSSEFESDLFVRNLELGGIQTRVFSSREYAPVIGESQNDRVNIYVPIAQSARAVQLLQSLGLLDAAEEQSTLVKKDQFL